MSCYEAKRKLYASDPDYLAGCKEIFSDSALALVKNFLWTTGLVLLKPETVAGGYSNEVERLITLNGYEISRRTTIFITKKQVERLWYYAQGRYTPERMSLLCELFEAGPSVLLVVRGNAGSRLPLSVLLTVLKGETNPEGRLPWTLRAQCGGVKNTFFNYIHTSDEPCDVVRELAILKPDCMTSIVDPKHTSPSVEDGPLFPALPKSSLDLSEGAVRERLICLISQISDMEARRAAFSCLEEPITDAGRWAPLLLVEIEKSSLKLEPLDRVYLQSASVPLKRSSRTEAFPSCELADWDRYILELAKSDQIYAERGQRRPSLTNNGCS